LPSNNTIKRWVCQRLAPARSRRSGRLVIFAISQSQQENATVAKDTPRGVFCLWYSIWSCAGSKIVV
jgi:hypothetical protein